MRILWIEDFGGKATVDGLIGGLTGWLNDESIDVLADEVNNILRSDPHDFEGWRRFYQTSSSFTSLGHEVDFCMHFLEVERMLDSNKTCDNYDVVLIDIDLSENDFFTVMPDSVEPTLAGFWIYNRLVHAGFPPERLAFFTGNDDKAGEFVIACSEFYIHPKPTSFSKIRPDENKGVTLSNWLTSLEQAADRYIMLRRGVLDGCRYLENFLIDPSVTDVSDIIQFNRYIAGESESRMLAEEAREYLFAVSSTLPVKHPTAGQQPSVVRLFLRTLAHEWEDKAHPGNLRQRDPLLSALGWTMKNTRNWLSHSRFLEHAGTNDLAFLFLVNMRAMFALKDELETYELQLLRLFGTNTSPLQDDQITASLILSYVAVKNILVEKIRNHEKSQNGKRIEDETHYNQVVNALIRAEIQLTDFDFLKSLYKIFWHGLARIESPKFDVDPNPTHRKVVLHMSYVLKVDMSKYPPWVKNLTNAIHDHSFSDLN